MNIQKVIEEIAEHFKGQVTLEYKWRAREPWCLKIVVQELEYHDESPEQVIQKFFAEFEERSDKAMIARKRIGAALALPELPSDASSAHETT